MTGQPGFFDVDDRLKALLAKGEALERLNAIVDFEQFRPVLMQAIPCSDGSKGGRPGYNQVFMFKVLVLQASHLLSDERTEFLIKDRLSFMCFLGLGLADPVPDANTIWTFRNALTGAVINGVPAIEELFAAYETALRAAGFLAMGRPDRRCDGRVPPIARRRMGPIWKQEACARVSTEKRQVANPCHGISPAPTPVSRRSVPASSMFSPTRKVQ